MAVETASLVIKVDSSGAERATRNLDQLDRAAGGSERAASKLGKAWGVAIGIIGSVAVAGATRAYIRHADTMANLSARLRLVTGSQEEFNRAQEATFQIAQRSRTELDSVVDLYARMAQSTTELGLSQQDLIQLTETITQTFQISGATTQEAAGGLRQLSQAMAGGVLRAEEFNSIIESSPRLVRALADGMGIAFGDVRKYVNEGKISSEQLTRALLDQSQTIQREFGNMPLTVGGAMTQVQNAIKGMVGEADNGSRASKGLAESIERLARALESDGVRNGFTSLAIGIANVGTAAATAMGKFNDLWEAAQRWATFKLGGTGDVTNLQQIRYELEKVEGQLSTLEDAPGGGSRRLKHIERLQTEVRRLRDLESQSVMLFGDPAEGPRVRMHQIGGGTPDDLLNAPGGGGGSGDSTGSTKEQEAAAKRLQSAYESLAGAQREQIALFGDTTEAAKVRYAIEQGELSGLAAAKKAQLVADAELIDSLNDLAAIEDVWAQGQQQSLDILNRRQDAIWEQQQATAGLIRDLEFERSLIGLSNVEREKAIALRYAGVDATTAEGRAIAGLVEEIERGREAEAAVQDIKRGMGDVFTSIIDGSGLASDAFAQMIDNMKRRAMDALADKAIDGLIAGFAGMAGGGGWGGFASGFARGFGGGRAGGGPVMSGQGYWVGENGREWFQPAQNGSVVQGPTQQLSPRVTVNIHNAPQGAEVRERQGPDGGFDIDVIFNQIEGRMAGNVANGTGSLYAAQKNRFNLRDAI